ncbi:ribosomal protein S18 acetylase RimI-like enzyme [Halanaerobium saccharolyticum]|uniref:Ribosomal protein S18 acetylase RimI-like enzyme n=1 Tax=Halanaerobium saccharolyticum TaxID=43595 RepID=A0A4R6LTJ8_9FIRM|nr:GNAT family N-acetyltransferase [Halanaerobium saccharolyticum]TDO91989.1 ribosomal protein S18 acetylase RimI-like enzyme [Halanaerobium saccharolyticum]
MQFKKVEKNDLSSIKRLSKLAAGIVKKHFDPIIGPEQNDYMIEKFQSAESIIEQLAEGYQYYFVQDNQGEDLGFLAFYPKEEEMYLSKFYLKAEARGKGLSRKMLDFVIKAAKKENLDYISLNVNKNNDAIKAYQKLGFEKIGEQKKDIGSGFYMDDYVFQYKID